MASIRKILGIIGGFLVSLSGEAAEARGPDITGAGVPGVATAEAQEGARPLSREQLEAPFQMAGHVNSRLTEKGVGVVPAPSAPEAPTAAEKTPSIPVLQRLPDLQRQAPVAPGSDKMGAWVVPRGTHTNSGPTGHANAPGHADFTGADKTPGTRLERTRELGSKSLGKLSDQQRSLASEAEKAKQESQEQTGKE